MRGRKPIPTHLKRARGNPGKRPLNHEEPQPEVKAPPCPDFLDEEARAEWGRVVEMLARNGIITELDATALAAYCQAYSRWANAERQLAKYGPVILSPDKKFPIQSPYLAIANKAHEHMLKILVEFGMTPSSRSRVHIVRRPGSSSLAQFRARCADTSLQGQMDELDAFIQQRRELARPLNKAEELYERARRRREEPN